MVKRLRRSISIALAVMLMLAAVCISLPIKSYAAYSINNYLAKWEGEYTGSDGGTNVMRHFILILNDYSANSDGTYEVKGTLSFSASHDSAQAAISSEKGSYYIKGTANPSTGEIKSMSGYDWIDYPGSFSFITFNGSFKNANRIEGKTDNDIFYCDKISSISSSTSVLMTLKGMTTTTDLLKATATFKKGSTNICTIVACDPSSWGGEQYGNADLVQGSKVIRTSKTGAFVDVVPGQEMSAGTAVKVVFKDASGNTKKTVTTKLNITNPTTTLKAPAKTAITDCVVTYGKKSTFRVYWKKKNCDGYQVQIATSKKFTKKSIKGTSSVTGQNNNYVRIDKVPNNKIIYFRVRCFNTSGGKYKYSSWSAVKGAASH
jgi:hypothetical protein